LRKKKKGEEKKLNVACLEKKSMLIIPREGEGLISPIWFEHTEHQHWKRGEKKGLECFPVGAPVSPVSHYRRGEYKSERVAPAASF